MTPDPTRLLTNLLDCLNGIKTWMANNFLQLNIKMKALILGSGSVAKLTNALSPLSGNDHSVVRHLGILLDSSLNLNYTTLHLH